MRKAHTYDETTDTDEFFFSGRAWWFNWAMLVLLLASQVFHLYSYQTSGRIYAVLVAILCAGLSILFVLGATRRAHPVLVISGSALEYVDLITLWLKPRKVSIDGVNAVNDINGTLHLRYESGAFERVPLSLIEASARSEAVESVKRRIANNGSSATA